MKRIVLLLLLLTFYVTTYAQLSTREPPVSFIQKVKGKRSIATITMPFLDMKKIEAEDKEDGEWGMPPRFGYMHQVNYNLNNSGTWTKLSNGDKLWRLKVVCPGALSVNFLYDKFWLPEGGKFFVYSVDKKHQIGAFTSRNNKGDKENVRGFATGLVYGSEAVLEYYQPKEVVDDAIISISFVVHGYRYIRIGNRDYGDSNGCLTNVNCFEGQNWQNEKRAIALILVGGHRVCTGSLINSTANDQKPLLLTANHCLIGDGNHLTPDAQTAPNVDYYSFYWNYEEPGCYYFGPEPDTLSTHGATVLANYSFSNRAFDFALLRLIEDPKNLSGFTPYYLGWDKSGNSGGAGVCIHHPQGDVKKISTVDSIPQSSTYFDYLGTENSHWKLKWKSTINRLGITKDGSSGSPLLNSEHKVIGQLHDGTKSCIYPNEYNYFGKLNYSWIPHDTCSVYRRLDCWVDSIGTGQLVIKGLQIIQEDDTLTLDMIRYSNIRIKNGSTLTILNNIALVESSTIIVESGGTLIVDGGTISNVNIDMKVGSTLRVINNGKFETQNGFVAPIGAIVSVDYGQIL